jgi:indole-3-acetate monooxygenase
MMAVPVDKNHAATGDGTESAAFTADQMLSRIAALAPLIVAHIPETEHERRLSKDIVDALRSAGVYSMLIPRRYGGVGLDGPGALRVVSALAKCDGSVGWNVMTGQIANLALFLTTPGLCARIFGDGKDPITAGSGQPAGTAERVPGGWKVSGVWPFASNCLDADWIFGVCVMTEKGSAIPAAEAHRPMTRACLMPAECWEIRDTWHSFGLKGTGSHDVALHDVFVADEQVFAFPIGLPFAPDPVFAKFPDLVILMHSAWAVGAAEGAIQDLVALATSGIKQARMAFPLAETERFKEGLGRLTAELAAASALLETQATRVWQATEHAMPVDMNRFAEHQALGVWISTACVRVAEGCFELAGSRAVFENSPLQRRLRDLQVAATHAGVHQRNYVSAGTAILSRTMT